MRLVFAIAMKHCGVIVLTAVLCAVSPSVSGASSDVQPLDVKSLAVDLDRVRGEIGLARTNMALFSKGLNEAQAQLAKQDPEYGRLLADKAVINSNLVVRLAELDLQIENSEAWQSAEKVRRTAVERLSQARERETTLQAELAVAPSEASHEAESAWMAATRERQEAQNAMELAEQALLRVKHDLCYQAGPCQDLHQDIKRQEAELFRINGALAVREKLNETWRKADQARRQAYAQLKAAQQQELVLHREIVRLENGAGSARPADAGKP